MSECCTWKDCADQAEHVQTARDGSVWANLCTKHRDMLDGAIEGFALGEKSPEEVISSWIRAREGRLFREEPHE